MKKKSFLFLLASLFCLILFGCKEETSNSHRRYFTLRLYSSDGTSIYPYGPTPTDGIYILKDHQTYKLLLRVNGPWEMGPESIGIEFDDTIFEIVCLTTPESEGNVNTEVSYHLTCLKKCDSASFVVYPQHHSDADDPCRYEFTFRVE